MMQVMPFFYGTTMLSKEDIESQIIEVLEQLEPYFLMHGGMISFSHFDEKDGTVFVTLEGNCGGCSASSTTLGLLVEGELKREVPQVKRVIATE